MTGKDVAEELILAVADVEEDKALKLARKTVSRGVDPMLIIDACQKGLDIVGDRYERREYFLSALIMSGEIFREITVLLEEKGYFRPSEDEDAPKVILGAPLGDVHDLGKYIVSVLLRRSAPIPRISKRFSP